MDKEEIVQNLLQQCIDYVKVDSANSNHYETFSFALQTLREISETSLLFGYEIIFNKSDKLYTKIESSKAFKESILKFQQPIRNNITNAFKNRLSHSDIKEKYPTITKEDIFQNMRKTNETHINLTLENKHKEALTNATKQLHIEEIALTLIVMNKFEESEYVYSNFITEKYRNDHKELFYIIEYARINEWEKAKKLLKYLTPIANSLGVYERLHLVKGLKELEPWSYYPYPDY